MISCWHGATRERSHPLPNEPGQYRSATVARHNVQAASRSGQASTGVRARQLWALRDGGASTRHRGTRVRGSGRHVRPTTIHPEYGLLLVHALLLDSTSGSLQIRTIGSVPTLLPLSLGKLAQAIARDLDFEFHHQGFGDDVVELRGVR